MLEKRDYIYYDFRFKNIKSKKMIWKIYCYIRKTITVKESPSKVCIYQWVRGD